MCAEKQTVRKKRRMWRKKRVRGAREAAAIKRMQTQLKRKEKKHSRCSINSSRHVAACGRR